MQKFVGARGRFCRTKSRIAVPLHREGRKKKKNELIEEERKGRTEKEGKERDTYYEEGKGGNGRWGRYGAGRAEKAGADRKQRPARNNERQCQRKKKDGCQGGANAGNMGKGLMGRVREGRGGRVGGHHGRGW